ncbi:hypothetical protein SAMN05216339_1119 [Nitrosomonas eutropha]|uniref:Uncharacterized protein n=1 Tax=Nitrosomonas eutropha TaxID=916 RepID=A0A1I7ITN9_9PROT|nr:hypothetical protein SAMN05216339_1119 [Nitrosomonas eutropha]
MGKHYPSDISREQFEQLRLSVTRWFSEMAHGACILHDLERAECGGSEPVLKPALKNPLARFVPDRGATLAARS